MQAQLARLFSSPIGHQTIGSIILKLTNAGFTFVSAVLLARLMGPSEYGIYSYVYALVTLLSVPSQFGLPTLVIRETARGMASEDYGRVQGVWNWATRTTLLISLSLVGVTLAGMWVFREPLSSQRMLTFLWALVLVPLIALGELRGAALTGLRHVLAGQLPEFLLGPGIFAALLAAVWVISNITLTAPVAMALYVVASAVAFGIGAWLLWRTTPPSVRLAAARFENRLWLMSALPLAFIGAMQLINQQASILLQGFFLADADIGIFRVATQVSMLAALGLVAVNAVVAPRFAALHTQGEMARLQRLATLSARAIFLFSFALTIGFVVLGIPFLRIFFGAAYERAYVPMLILLAGQLVNAGTGSVVTLLNMTGYERETAKGIVLSAGLNLVLNLWLIPLWGIVGSAVATTASMIVWNLVLWWAVRKNLGVNTVAFARLK